MKKYRRIEVNAFRRRVTVVSGEWRPGDVFDPLPSQTDDEVSLNDTDVCEPVEPDSAEGQLLLVEAVRSLERRLLPETRATICEGQHALPPNPSSRNGFYFKLQSFFNLFAQTCCALLERRNENV